MRFEFDAGKSAANKAKHGPRSSHIEKNIKASASSQSAARVQRKKRVTSSTNIKLRLADALTSR